MRCRFIDTGLHDAYWNMSLDESVLRHVSDGSSPPTLRLYSWKPSAVSVGYFQSLREEVDVDECFRRGVDIVRRITGGGAVYHDREVTYSFIAPEKCVADDILQSYRHICSGLVSGLKFLGIDAQFAPLNDIISHGKKISGNAQTRRQDCVLQHGTLLLDVDVGTMFSLLRVPSQKLRDKMIADAKDRVTSVRHVLKKEVSYDTAAAALKRGFATALKLDLHGGSPTKSELTLALELQMTKYRTLEWNDKR